MLKTYFKQYGIIILLMELFVIIGAVDEGDYSMFAAIVAGICATNMLNSKEQNELIRSLPFTRNHIALSTIAFVQITYVMSFALMLITDIASNYKQIYSTKEYALYKIGQFMYNEYAIMLAMFILVIAGSIASALLIGILFYTVLRIIEAGIFCFANIFFGYKSNSLSGLMDNVNTIMLERYSDLTSDFSSKSAYIDMYIVCVLGVLLLVVVLAFAYGWVYRRTEYFTKGFFSLKFAGTSRYVKNIIISVGIAMYVSSAIVYWRSLSDRAIADVILPTFTEEFDANSAMVSTEYLELTRDFSPVVGVIIIVAAVVVGIIYTRIRDKKRGVKNA